MDKDLLKEFIKSDKTSTAFLVFKAGSKTFGELLVECDTLKEARIEQKAFKGKTVILKSTAKIVK